MQYIKKGHRIFVNNVRNIRFTKKRKFPINVRKEKRNVVIKISKKYLNVIHSRRRSYIFMEAVLSMELLTRSLTGTLNRNNRPNS